MKLLGMLPVAYNYLFVSSAGCQSLRKAINDTSPKDLYGDYVCLVANKSFQVKGRIATKSPTLEHALCGQLPHFTRYPSYPVELQLFIIPLYACDVFIPLGIVCLTIGKKTGKPLGINRSLSLLIKRGVLSKLIKTN